MNTEIAPVLIAGEWRDADTTDTFSAVNPKTGKTLAGLYPQSSWADVDAALGAAEEAFFELQRLPRKKLAEFLHSYADALDTAGDAICKAAAEETGLPYEPRLRKIELGRTTDQLRQAADAAVDPSWRLPTIDPDANLRSVLEPIGPVVVFGPNNFPLAFNGLSGGDFAAAVAAGNPVIAIGHPCHPKTCRLLADCARETIESCGLPAGTIQLIYATSRADGLRLVSDPRLGAAAFTGSRIAGKAMKAAADAVGKPIYLAMPSVNPVVILPGALAERGEKVVDELVSSALMGSGQFCTNPGLVITLAGDTAESFIQSLAAKYKKASCETLLGQDVLDGMIDGIKALIGAGARLVTGGNRADRPGFAFENTLLRVDGKTFLAKPADLQTEVFGNATLVVVAADLNEVQDIMGILDGKLAGSVYSAEDGRDDAAYDAIAPRLRQKVGRLLNDKMPTGVTVSPAMQHGGPFPATGHPHFTAVGIPAAMRRFTMLACYDNVREQRLPAILRSEE